MVLYLTSSFIPYQELGAYTKIEPLDCYGFFDDLKSEWTNDANVLYVPCDPNLTEENDHQLKRVLDAFEFSNLKVKDVKILDDKMSAYEMVKWADVIYLSGGHAPTQLSFMKKVKLKKALLGYEGIVIGLSAGSVNAAFYVYHMPELEGEATDPNYIRFADGLDLTNIQIIPHWDDMKNKVVDGLNFIDDIVIPDSYGCRFYMISDGSYFKVKNGKTTFKGIGQVIEDGITLPLKQGEIVPYMSYVEQPVIKTLISEGYDMIFSVEKHDEHCEIYYFKDYIGDVFKTSQLSYKEICARIAESVVFCCSKRNGRKRKLCKNCSY